MQINSRKEAERFVQEQARMGVVLRVKKTRVRDRQKKVWREVFTVKRVP